MKTIGVIGTGIMGSGMARRLLARGYPVVVFNRTREKTKAAENSGAVVANSPAELAARCDTALLAVRDDAALREMMLGPEGALAQARPKTTFINTSTVTPAAIVAVADAAEARGCALLDVPVTGSRAAAETGTLGLLVSGSSEVLESQRDVLEAIGQSILHLGPIGCSAAFKLANNQLAAVLVRAMGEGIALCEAAGLERSVAVEALAQTASRVCGLKRDKLLKRDWSTDFALELMYKDLVQTMQTAASLRVEMPLLHAAADLYAAALSDGEKDFAVIAEPRTGSRTAPAAG